MNLNEVLRKRLYYSERGSNAKVGMDDARYEDIMKRYGLGERNETDERFTNPWHSTNWL